MPVELKKIRQKVYRGKKRGRMEGQRERKKTDISKTEEMGEAGVCGISAHPVI